MSARWPVRGGDDARRRHDSSQNLREQRQRLVKRWPVDAGKARGQGRESVSPNDRDRGISDRVKVRGGGKVRRPLQGSRGTGVSGAVETAADGHPGHVPALDCKVGQALIEMLMKGRAVQARGSSAVSDDREVVPGDGGLASVGRRGAKQVDGQPTTHGLGELSIVAMRQGKEGHSNAARGTAVGSNPERGASSCVHVPAEPTSPAVEGGGDRSVAVLGTEGQPAGRGDLVATREVTVGPEDGTVSPA